jgi:phosphoglycolate phosphatase-like HAD superfamily hydrolase
MGQATTDAIETVWGLTLPGDAIRGVDHPGQTAMRITREMLRTAGLDNDEIDPQIARWCTEASRRYLELLADVDTSHWAAAEGAADAISQIEHRALLTGNPEPVARARMERIGLAEFFPPGQGAFGCEAESRDQLIAIARRKAGDWPAERTVAVGDTENDSRSTSRSNPCHRLWPGPRRRRCRDRADERAAADARTAQRRALSSRSIWRSASRFASSRRLSRCSLPRASASSSFARPFLK